MSERASRAASGAADTVSFDLVKPTKVWELGPGVHQLKVLAMLFGTKLARVCIAGADVWCCGGERPYWLEISPVPGPPMAKVQRRADLSPETQPPVEASPERWISVAKDEVFKKLWNRVRVKEDVEAVILRIGNVEPATRITQNGVQPDMITLFP